MGCSEFLEHFSEYFDGVGEPAFLAEADAHVASCDQCRRYRDVVVRGRELMQAAPGPRVSRDFYPRLKHRIYHVEDADALAKTSVGSATSGAAVLGIAVVLTVVAWSPLMRDKTEVELAPIVVDNPRPTAKLGLRPPPVRLTTNDDRDLVRPLPGSPGTVLHFAGYGPHPTDLLESSQLIWEYSPLYDQYGDASSLRRVGMD
jgi:hypothetical protein